MGAADFEIWDLPRIVTAQSHTKNPTGALLTTTDSTGRTPALTQTEMLDIVDTIDACTNRFGPMASQRGARKVRAVLFAAIECPSAPTWLRAQHILISDVGTQRTFGRAVKHFAGFDSDSVAHPTRQQMLASLKAASATS